MSIQTKDFVDVAARARGLGCRVPERIALLPGNFSKVAHTGEFCYHAATPYVRSAWQSVGLEDEGPGRARGRARMTGFNAPSARVPLTVFFGSRLRGGPAWCLAVALGMVSTVLAFHPDCASPREVRCDIVVERPGRSYACLEYLGDAYGLAALATDVQRVWSGK